MSREVRLINYLANKYRDVSLSSLALKKISGNYEINKGNNIGSTRSLSLRYSHGDTPLLYRILEDDTGIRRIDSKPYYLLFSNLKLYRNSAGKINRNLSRTLEEMGKFHSICQLGCDIVAISIKSNSKLLMYIKYHRSFELLQDRGFKVFPSRELNNPSSENIWVPHKYPTIISNYGITLQTNPVEDLNYWISR